MPSNNSRLLVHWAVTGFLLLACLPVRAQLPNSDEARRMIAERAALPAGNLAQTSLDMLRSMYPDINPRSRVIIEELADWRERPSTHGALLADFAVVVCDSYWREEPMEGKPQYGLRCPVTTLHGLFSFKDFKTEWVPDVIISRPETEKRQISLGASLKAHPPASYAEYVRMLKVAGVRYGPDDWQEFLKSIPKEQFEPYLGKLEFVQMVFRADEVDFADEDENGDFIRKSPSWTVLAWAGDREFTMLFSAFDGKLEALHPSGREPRWRQWRSSHVLVKEAPNK